VKLKIGGETFQEEGMQQTKPVAIKKKKKKRVHEGMPSFSFRQKVVKTNCQKGKGQSPNKE